MSIIASKTAFVPYPIGTVGAAKIEVEAYADSNKFVGVQINNNYTSTNLDLVFQSYFSDLAPKDRDAMIADPVLKDKIVTNLAGQISTGAFSNDNPQANTQALQQSVKRTISDYVNALPRDPALKSLNDRNDALGLPNVGPYLLGDIKKPYNPNDPKIKQASVPGLVQEEQLSTKLTLPSLYNRRTGNSSSLQEVITGSDLSVFYISEVYKIQDTMDFPESPWLWRKDIVLMELDTAMSISYSTLREVFPVRTLGQSKPKGFTRGPMSISGHITFSVFTEDVLDRLRTQMLASIEQVKAKTTEMESRRNGRTRDGILSKAGEDRTKIAADKAAIAGQIAENQKQLLMSPTQFPSGTDVTSLRETLTYKNAELNNQLAAQDVLLKGVDSTSEAQISKITNGPKSVPFTQNLLYEKILRENSVYLLNQLGPFHLLVMGTNETGTFAKMMIKGVRVIDENQMQGVSQPNIVNRITFAAEDLVPMTSINANSNVDATAKNDMFKFGGNNLSMFTGSDVMRSIEYMTTNSSSDYMNVKRNY
jgi:hypothetical protein